MVHKSTDNKPSRGALRHKKTKNSISKRKVKAVNLVGEFEKSSFQPCNEPTEFPKSKRITNPKNHANRHPMYHIPVRRIVIHTTGTPLSKPLVDLDSLPYHFVISKYGRLVNIRELAPRSSTIEIALMGGVNKHGVHCDTRTSEQNEVLFGALVMLTDYFPNAKIVGADKIYVYNHVNPGFDIQKWLGDFIPEFLQNAV